MTEITDLKEEVALLRLAIQGLVAQTKQSVPEKVYKTFSQHDFSGYDIDTLRESLGILEKQINLPGPLRLVQNALSKAYNSKLTHLAAIPKTLPPAKSFFPTSLVPKSVGTPYNHHTLETDGTKLRELAKLLRDDPEV